MSPPRCLIIVVHPSRDSFTAAWAQASSAAAAAIGEVRFADLYADGFDPAERPNRYGTDEPDVMRAQDAAVRDGRLPPDIASHINDLLWADRVIFHFPLWWFAPPAMLKGWCDRVLLHGALHDSARRFDAGLCRGKRALFCVTTGSRASESGPGGKEGDARLLLWPLAYTLRYCGFDVCAPELVHGVHGFHSGAARDRLEDRLADILAAQAALVSGMDTRALWRFNADRGFDETGTLLDDEPVLWPFIDPDGQPAGAG